jgi:hypothetical protein
MRRKTLNELRRRQPLTRLLIPRIRRRWLGRTFRAMGAKMYSVLYIASGAGPHPTVLMLYLVYYRRRRYSNHLADRYRRADHHQLHSDKRTRGNLGNDHRNLPDRDNQGDVWRRGCNHFHGEVCHAGDGESANRREDWQERNHNQWSDDRQQPDLHGELNRVV